MKAKSKKKSRIIIAVIAIIVAAVLILILAGGEKESYNEITAKTREIATYYSFSGNIKAEDSRYVISEQSMKVKDIMVSEGDIVKADTVLAVLDSTDLEKQIEQTEAKIESNNINIYYAYSQSTKAYEEAKSKLENGTNMDINNANTAVQSAKLALDSANKKYSDAADSVSENSRDQIRRLQSELESARITFSGKKRGYLDELKKYSGVENESEILALEQKLSDAKEILNAKKAGLKEVQEDAAKAEAAAKELNKAQENYDDLLEDIYDSIVSYQVKGARMSMQAAEAAMDNLSDALSDLLDGVNKNLYDLKLAKDNAQIGYDKALFTADAVEAASRTQLESYREAMEKDRKLIESNPALLELSNMKEKLNDCVIKAPIDGVVTKIFIKEGTYASAGQTAMEVMGTESLKVTMLVDEYDIFSIQKGKEVSVYVNALDKEVTGIVTSVSESAETMNGISYFTAEASIPRGENIKVGMSAEVKLLNQKAESAVSLPVSALQFDEENKPYVLFKEEGKKEVTHHYITIGINDGTYAEIIDGLKDGDVVYVPKKLFDFNPMEMMMG